MQQFTQAADDHADQREEGEANAIVYAGLDPEAVARFDEEVVQGLEAEKVASNPGRKPPRYAAIMTAGTKEMYSARSFATSGTTSNRDRQRDRRGQHGHAVGEQSDA